MAQVYLSNNDSNFILGSANSSIYGQSGSESVFIRSGVSGIQTDQNTDRVNIEGDISDFSFQQAGNQFKVYSGATLVVTISVQADGSQIVFSDGSVELTLSAGVMALGGKTVPAGAASSILPISIDASTTSSEEDPGNNSAQVFLDSGDTNFQIFNSGTTVFASSGAESVCCGSEVSGIVVDQNTERIDILGAHEDFTYQQAGNRLMVFRNGLNVLTLPVQGDSDGSQLVFTNGSTYVRLSSGQMTLGGATVGASAGSVTPNDIDPSITAGDNSGGQTQGQTEVSADIGTLNAVATLDAGTGAFKYTDDASVLNNVEIFNFTSDDSIAISNATVADYFFANDGEDVNISYNNSSTVNMITLIGVVSSSAIVYDQASFEAAVGFDAFSS